MTIWNNLRNCFWRNSNQYTEDEEEIAEESPELENMYNRNSQPIKNNPLVINKGFPSK